VALNVEGRYTQTQARMTQLKTTYTTCVGDPVFDDVIDLVEGSLLNIRDAAVSAISDRMGGMYLTYIKQCATSILPVETAETFEKDMDAVTAIATGDYFDGFDSQIDSWIGAIPLLSCVDLINALNGLNSLINDKISAVTALVGDWVNENILQSDIGQAVSLVASIAVACGEAMYSSIAGLDNSILDEDSGLRKAVDSAKYAKNLSSDPTEILNLVKGKITTEQNFDGRMTGIKDSLISHTSSLLS